MRARVGVVFLAIASVCGTRVANAQAPFRFQYVAKIVCGTPTSRDTSRFQIVVQPYATVINVYSPTDTAQIWKKLALGYPEGNERPGALIPFATDTLLPGRAFAIDCRDVARNARQRPSSFFDGFVIILSSGPLDVVGVYTVRGGIDVAEAREHVLKLQ